MGSSLVTTSSDFVRYRPDGAKDTSLSNVAAFEPHISAHELCEHLCRGESEALAVDGPRGRIIQLEVGAEEVRGLFGGDPRACVGYTEDKMRSRKIRS